MHCPFCSVEDTKVIDSRLSDDGARVRRRRECMQCNERFTTYEIVELHMPQIIKRDGARTAFNEEKLRYGMQKALEKRPVTAGQLDQAVQTISRILRSNGEREVSSLALGELVMEQLRELDKVAYVRFASVYRSFADVDAFHAEIERLKQHGSEKEEENVSAS